jgi:hypothetical protein
VFLPSKKKTKEAEEQIREKSPAVLSEIKGVKQSKSEQKGDVPLMKQTHRKERETTLRIHTATVDVRNWQVWPAERDDLLISEGTIQ